MLILLPGCYEFVEGDIILALFQLQRIVGDCFSAEDLDDAAMTYGVICRHYRCLSEDSFPHIIDGASYGSIWMDNTYIHPNLGVDGWERLKEEHAEAMDFMNVRKLPDRPSFWILPGRGSVYKRWPPSPSFFDDWIDVVSRGGALSLDPALPVRPRFPSPLPPSSPEAGPSNQGLSLQSPPPSTSDRYSPLSSLSSMSISRSPSPDPQGARSPSLIENTDGDLVQSSQLLDSPPPGDE